MPHTATINGITYESLKCRFVSLLGKFRFPLNDFLLVLVNLFYRKMIQTNVFQVCIMLTTLEYNLVTLQFVHSWAKIYRILQNDLIYFSLTYCLQNYIKFNN